MLAGVCNKTSADSFSCRTEPHGPHYELLGVPVHGTGRVVGRRQGYIERCVSPKARVR